MNSTSRRHFLRTSTAAALGAGAFGPFASTLLYAQDKSKIDKNCPTLVAVYLRGGADALNAIIPYADPTYYEIRPTISIATQDAKDDKGVVKLNNFFGLHPSFAPVLPLFEKGVLAPIINVGSPNETRSHFDAQDFMERAAPGVKTIVQGWLNRYLAATREGKDNELRALSFQPLLPRSLRGEFPVLAVPDGDSQRMIDTFEDLYTCEEKAILAQEKKAAENPGKTGAPVKPNLNIRRPITSEDAYRTIVTSGTNEIRRLRELKDIVSSGRGEGYPGSHFGRQMRDIATVIKAQRGLEVAAIDYEGWDHHAYEGGSEGVFARMVLDVSKVLKAFYEDLGDDRMKKVVVLLMSEFGRTAKENGTAGTDHGRGGFMLALGGMVKGKNVYGKWTGLAPENLADRRDLPVTTDFRQVFAETLECVFGFDTMKNKAFPDWRPARQPLNFLNKLA